MKKILLSFLIIIVLLPNVFSLGITDPLPSTIEVETKDSARFKFNIETFSTPEHLLCNIELDDNTDFSVEFDSGNEIEVLPNQRKELYGTIKTDSNIELKEYTRTFCIYCETLSDNKKSGVAVNKNNVCGLPININVVTKRMNPNMAIPQSISKSYSTLIISIVIIISLILLLFYYNSKYKMNKKRRKERKKGR